MSISITFSKTEKYLEVKIEGKWVTNDILDAIKAIRNEAAQQEIKHILLNLTALSYPDNEMTRYFSGMKLASEFDYSYKIAGYSQAEKINRFAETVAVNRGARFRMFTGEPDAVKWLLGIVD